MTRMIRERDDGNEAISRAWKQQTRPPPFTRMIEGGEVVKAKSRECGDNKDGQSPPSRVRPSTLRDWMLLPLRVKERMVTT